MICFFFSSRRRHTRLVSDWSSDVCSSDLGLIRGRAISHQGLPKRLSKHLLPSSAPDYEDAWRAKMAGGKPARAALERSEERRVGKEGRSQRAQRDRE